MSEPLVSVLVPTYNGERFLRPALRSALEQSHRTIEVIVGDDGSTDRTAQILAAVAAADDRVRVITHARNLGPYDNALALLEAARGEYVKFLLHDDVLATDCVREMVRGMQAAPEATLAFSHRALVDEDGRPIQGRAFPKLRDRTGLVDGRELGDHMLESCTNVVGEFTTMMWRRADLDLDGLWQVDGRRLDVLTDLKVALALLARGPAFYTPRTLSRFRLHPTQNTWKPWFFARGVRDWPRLLDWSLRQGFLQDPDRQRRAFATALAMASARVAELATGPDHGPALEAVLLSTARLVELGAGEPLTPARSVMHRAHDSDLLARFRQELDVWTTEYPVALAAPALDATEIRGTVLALREVLGAGVAKKAVAAVPVDLLDQAVPLFESALAELPDLDLDLVPADDPGGILADTPWLAVAPAGSSWHDGRARAVWSFDSAPLA